MVLNALFEFTLVASVVFTIIVSYNLYYYITRRFSSCRHSEVGRTVIGYYRNRAIISGGVLGIFLAFILFYTRPISYEKMITFNKGNRIDVITVWGRSIGEEEIFIEGNEIQIIEGILSEYKYIRTFNYDTIGAEGIYMFSDMTVIEIYSNGYVRIPNYTVYKIDSKVRDELFNKLVKVLNVKKVKS